MQTFQEFRDALEKSPELQNEFKQDPVKAVQQFEQHALSSDKWIYRLVVSSLGLIILLIIIGVIVLMFNDSIKDDKSVPTIFTAIGSAAIGALAGLLAPQPNKS